MNENHMGDTFNAETSNGETFNQDAQGSGYWSTEEAYAASPVKEKKRISLGAATAMAIVAAVASGAITGVYVNNERQPEPQSVVVENLKTQPTSHAAPKVGSVEDVASVVLPSVVSIQVLGPSSRSEGSGSIISEDGYVLTNNHVIEDAKRSGRIVVTLNDGSRYDADLVAGDPNTDVAVIKMRDAHGLSVINFGDSSSVKVGQEVVAVGSPLGLSATVTSGIVSALNRPVRASGSNEGETSLIDAIQTDAAINPGNSGGPLVDMAGNLIGMNSVIATTSTLGGSSGSIGLGFAIPANFARRVATQLIETGEAKQPMIGIQVQDRPDISGALVVSVTPGGPGDEGGLRSGDVITGVNERRLESADALIAAVRSSDFGAQVTLKVTDLEGENPRDVHVTLTSE